MLKWLIPGLVALPLAAYADSTVSNLPDAAVPLAEGSALYVDQGPGTDAKISHDWGAALGILNAPASTIRGNPTGATAAATAIPMPNCPDAGGVHLNVSLGPPMTFTCGTSGPTLTAVEQKPADPPGVSSATAVMSGLGVGWSYTPNATGKTLVIFNGIASNSGASGGANLSLRYGTGTAPTAGATATGTVAGQTTSALTNATSGRSAVPMVGYLTLVKGTTYWFDITLAWVLSGTASVTATQFDVVELP